MDSVLDGITSALVSKSLDLALLEHKVLANNIANANTVGYKPLQVNFEQQMQRIEQLVQGDSSPESISELKSMDITGAVEVNEALTAVRLDQEMAKLAQNTINYQALLTAKGKLGSLLSMAINGGRS